VPDTRRIPEHEIHAAIDRVVQAISARHFSTKHLLLLGIANGGIELAKRLATRIPNSRVGILDISFHRDDITKNPIPKEFVATHIPTDPDNATVILVDDVLFSGRTVKAALDELFDHGRPAQVELAILVDRGGRKLPFAPDYCGLKIDASPQEKVVVTLNSQDPAKDLISIRSTP
jgi:pyrimidine operon attenuation protein/uracil phosphoribosyltransferase